MQMSMRHSNTQMDTCIVHRVKCRGLHRSTKNANAPGIVHKQRSHRRSEPVQGRYVCRAQLGEAQPSRRQALLACGIGTLLAGNQQYNIGKAFADEEELLPVTSLNKQARGEQVAEILSLVKKSVLENVSDSYENTVQLALLDALGGANGSVHLPGELKTLGMSNLEPTLKQIGKAKEQVEKESKFPLPISWADMIALTGYFKVKKHFADTIISRASDPTKGQVLLQAYGNDVPVPQIGRVDAEAPDFANSSDLDLKLEALIQKGKDKGLTYGQLAALTVAYPVGESKTLEEKEQEVAAIDPKLANYVSGFQRSRKELTQTSYQTDFGRAYYKLTTLGAQFDLSRYFHPIPRPRLPKKL